MIDRPVAFIHIPRTSGTALKNHLIALTRASGYGNDNIKHNYDAILVASAVTKHDLNGVKFISGHSGLGMHRLLDNPYVLTMLRDPLQRAVSSYNFIKLIGHHYLHEFANKMTLREFIISHETRHVVSNYQARFIAYDYDMRKLWYESGMPEGAEFMKHFTSRDPVADEAARLELAKSMLANRFDFVGISEMFTQSLEFILRDLDLPMSLPKRKHIFRDHLADVDSKTIEILINQNQVDIELYKFATQLLDRRIKHESSLSNNRIQPTQLHA